MLIHSLDPIIFKIGFITIRWYSLAYILGILIGWWLGKKIITFKSKINNRETLSKNFDDLITYLIISIIIGGRMGYVLFYNFEYYIENPFDIIKIWEGGMSFHGGLIGVIIGVLFFCDFKKNFSLIYLDVIACVAPIGLFFGRIANFINSELFGKPSSLPWSIIFPKIDNVPRHPSQLYEAMLEGVVLFLIMLFLTFKIKLNNGVSASIFLVFYGVFRIFSEYFREPDVQVGYIFNIFSLGTLLSFIMVICGLVMAINLAKNEKQ